MNKKRIMQVVALVVVLSMMFTTAAFATQGNKQFKRDEENYKNAVNYLIQKEIMKGYGKGDYGLDGNVKRGDVIVMIVRAFELEDEVNAEELSDNFLDTAKGDYFYGPIAIAKKLKIAMGDGKYFKPNKPVTVQEAIWLIGRAEELVGKNLDIKGEDLDGLFDEDELNKFAKRKDIALMLHYVLTGEVEEIDEEKNVNEDEIDAIEYAIDEDEAQLFDEEDFEKAFAELNLDENEELEYVEFNFSVKNGKLYYEYDADDPSKTLVTEKTNYYVDKDGEDEISSITFVPSKDFNGTVYIKYMAYGDKDTSSEGLIKVTVGDVEEIDDILDDMKITIKENTDLNFAATDFKDFIDKVVFELLDDEEGTLYFDDDEDGKPEDDELLEKDEVITDKNLDDIILVPYQDFTGKFVIKYTASDEDKSYSGEINIVVKEVQEIKDMEIEDNDLSVKFDFLDELKKLVSDDLYDDFDYVKFELPETGTLKIGINEADDVNVDDEEEYDIDEIDDLTFESDAKGVFSFDFKAYDDDADFDNDKEYDGVIKITIEY